MRGFNRVILIGNCTRDPRLKNTPGGATVADFGLAINRKWTTQDGQEREEVTFVDCTAWNKLAEIIGQYVTKGKPLMVEGRLKLDQWEDKQGGGKRSKLSVVVETMNLLPSGGGASGSGADTGNPAEQEPQFTADDIPF